MTSNVTTTKNRIPYIVGTKPSIKNAQLLVSTGIPSLDHTIGGGLPIGSIFLIEEDTYGSYAKIVQKYFIAEGIVSTHSLLIASRDVEPSQILLEIPACVESTTVQEKVQYDEQMKIAWRYQNMKLVDLSPTDGQVFGHFYDLTKTMEQEVINNADVTQWSGRKGNGGTNVFENLAYADLLRTIGQSLKEGKFYACDSPNKRNVLRIAIDALGSRLWISDSEESSCQDLHKFLYYLRALLRNSYAVAVITIPVENFNSSDDTIERIEHMSDVAIRLESFAGSTKETNPLFKEYHGILHIKKLPTFNTLSPHYPESRDLVFKLRRRKFVIETLHLPPELEDSTQREQDDTVHGCGGSLTKNLLDF